MTLAASGLLAASGVAIPGPAPAPNEVGVMLSAYSDICVGTRSGAHIFHERGLDSSRGWLQAGGTRVDYDVGYGIQTDRARGRRSELPEASHGPADVHRWDEPGMSAIVVEGLKGRRGSRAHVWLLFDPRDPAARELAIDLARTTHYCRDADGLHGTQWREARREKARARAALKRSIRCRRGQRQ